MSRCFAAIDSAVTARRFGCSPVSLTFGMFVCSSILPGFTAGVFRCSFPGIVRSGCSSFLKPTAPSAPVRRRCTRIRRRLTNTLRSMFPKQIPLVLGRNHAVLVVVDFTSDRLLFNVLWTDWVCLGSRLEQIDLVSDFGDVYEKLAH